MYMKTTPRIKATDRLGVDKKLYFLFRLQYREFRSLYWYEYKKQNELNDDCN